MLRKGSDKRAARTVVKVVSDPRSGSIIFPNENNKYTFVDRVAGETLAFYQQRLVFFASAWYASHLKGRVDVVVVSDDAEFARVMGAMAAQVHVVTMRQYAEQYLSRSTILT